MAPADPDYIAYYQQPLPLDAVENRRTLAMQQWLRSKSDAQFSTAMDQIRNTQHAEAWRIFRHRNGRSLVRTVRIRTGEPIGHHPLGVYVDRENLAQGQDLGHGLVTALATLDVNQTILSIQRHDPLSWHCPAHNASPPWTNASCWDPPPPVPLRECSPCVRRPASEERPTHDVQRPYDPSYCIHNDATACCHSLTITFDTLDWPTRRIVSLQDTGRKRHDNHSLSRSMSRTNKRLRQTSFQSM